MWKETYRIGYELVDEQHKTLFDTAVIMKEILGNAEQPDYVDKITDRIVFLKGYCLNHFKDEEEYQKNVGFEGFPEHKKKHDKLVRDVLAYEKELVATNFSEETVGKFFGFLTTWLIYHVCGEDQQIPKRKAEPTAEKSDINIADHLQVSIKKVINILASVPEKTIILVVCNERRKSTGIGFHSVVTGASGNENVGIVYSDKIAFGILNAMTGVSVHEMNVMVHSAMQEVSGIISAHIAGLLSKTTGSDYEAATPEMVQMETLPSVSQSFYVRTTLGDMEVFIY